MQDNAQPSSDAPAAQPLFLASQLSTAQIEALRETGLGIEDMDAEEFAAMLDGEGEEVGVNPSLTSRTNPHRRSTKSQPESGSGSMRDELESDELIEDIDMGPTQLSGGTIVSSEKVRYVTSLISRPLILTLIFYRLSGRYLQTDLPRESALRLPYSESFILHFISSMFASVPHLA